MEKNNIQISKMTLSDLDEIKDSLTLDFDDFWNYNILKSELLSPNSNYFVARMNDQIVGFSGIKVIFDEAELMNIVVKKSCRGCGIASTMIEYIISNCKQNNIKILNLEVNSTNSIAIKLYYKYNFKQVGLRKKYYDGIDDAILMSLNLG